MRNNATIFRRLGLALLSIAIACCPCVLFGQELGVKAHQITIITIEAPSNASIAVLAYGSDFQPVPANPIDGGRRYEIGGSGNRLVIVTATDAATGWSKQTDIRIKSGTDPPDDDGDDGGDDGGGDDDPLPGEYDGPNDYKLGKLSFDSAPGYNAEVVRIYKAAGEFLYGRPEVKVMSVESGDPRKGTDFEIPVWIQQQFQPIANQNGDWRNWYEKIMGQMFQYNRDGAIQKTTDWYSAFNEIAAGVEARK